jgi:Spy/CpxP family protein refolding chaperone
MKQIFLAIMLCSFIGGLYAQRGPLHKDRSERIAERLNLTVEQQEQFKAIRKSHKGEFQTIKASNVSLEEKKAGMNALHQQVRLELKEVLDSDQLSKFDELTQAHKKRRHADHQVHKEAMKALDLTEQQKEQLKSIKQDSKSRLRALMAENISEEDRKSEAAAIRLEIDIAVKQLLSDEQYNQWLLMREKKADRSHKKGPGK